MFKITLNQELSHLVWDNVLWLPGVAPPVMPFFYVYSVTHSCILL